MDPPFSPSDFLHDSLLSLSISPKNPSWPSSSCDEEHLIFTDKNQSNFENDGSIVQSFEKGSENFFLPSTISTLFPSDFHPQLTPCHPFDYPQDINLNFGSETVSNCNNSDMIEATSAHLNTKINQTMVTLPSHFDMRHSINLSRSSSTSTMTCIDPNSLVLNNRGSSAESSCASTPPSRRDSSFSIKAEPETEDDQQAELRSMFEENFSISSTLPLVPNSLGIGEYNGAASSLANDLIMPDGTAYRFDGTSLVPVQSTYLGNVSATLPGNQEASLNLNPIRFSDSSVINHGFSMINGPCISLPDVSQFESHLSPNQSTADLVSFRRFRVSRSGSIAKRISHRRNPISARRTSIDSDNSASFSSDGSERSHDSRLRSLGRGGVGKDGNPRYRKEGPGMHKCPVENCQYQYNLNRELKRHLNVHIFAGQDKYRCVNCKSGLCRLDSVKRHMEAKGKAECLRRGFYEEFGEDGKLVRLRQCKPNWYVAAAANAASTKA